MEVGGHVLRDIILRSNGISVIVPATAVNGSPADRFIAFNKFLSGLQRQTSIAVSGHVSAQIAHPVQSWGLEKTAV
jgi:hypothetical protein